MKSSQKNSVAHLETMRHRRMRRIKRQRAIEVGKPVDVSLKPMALNPAQKRVLSDLHVQPLVDQKHGIMTPKSVSVMAALGLHLIAALLATYYIVWPTRLDAEATIVEIVHSIPTRSVRQQFCNIGLIRPSRVVETPNPNPSGLGCPTAPNSSGNFVPTPGYEKIRRGAFSSLEVTRPPSFRIRVEPKYPSEAKRAGKEGKVVLEATIDLDGKAKDIVIKADTVGFGCARAAIDALEASLFSPAKRGGENVSIRIAIPYQFKLEE
jgi:TonB family protein